MGLPLIREIGIPAVNDDVTRFQIGQERFNPGIHRISSLNHPHDFLGGSSIEINPSML